MRVLLMVLLLANLGFFAWQQWYDPDGDIKTSQGQRDTRLGAGLQLVGESARSSGQEPTADEPEAEAVPAESEPVTDRPESSRDAPEGEADVGESEAAPLAQLADACATVGPFEQLEMAQVARERLQALGSPASVRETGGQIRSGFWVYLPPYSSRDEAKRIEDELRGKNVSDLFIVTGSEQRNAISLGLFSTPERADQRAAEIGRLGYTPRVAERFRDATVYWVDFREQQDDPLEPERIGVMGAGDMLPEKRTIACEDIAVAAGPA